MGDLVEKVARAIELCFTSMPERFAHEEVMLDECARGTLHDFSRDAARKAIEASGLAELEETNRGRGQAIDELGAALARLVIEAEPWEGSLRRSATFEHFTAHREARETLIKYGFGA